jgi:serine/threonine protein kinase
MAHEATKDHDERLQEVLLEYVEAIQAGQAPDRYALLVEHPDLRAELEDFFTSHDEVERLAAPLRRAQAESIDTGGSISERRKTVPSEAVNSPADSTAAPLGQLGDFRLLREIGRGGMGVVYEAEQISLRRQVALKVLPFAAAIDPRQLQRFRNESLAAAHLHHENIVPVYAVGSERGVHYYAMQLIEGQSLAALIAGLRGTKAVPPGAPSAPAAETTGPYLAGDARETRIAKQAPWEDCATSLPWMAQTPSSATTRRRYFDWAAGIGRQAALALEHAHQLGIIHRDIKPANLLLDPRGQLWVTDFGLAQVSGDAGVTVTGELLGTLRYASPEQALGKKAMVDHRSDIYSLGATLYELLTLKPIFDGRDRHELLRQIAVEEPRPPRTFDRAVPAELETIIMKACAKEPDERYATAQELADDLQRFLEDRPIRARRPSLLEKTTKWARRHRSLVVSGVAALVLSVAGLSAATVISVRAYDREREKAKEAEESFRQARDAVRLFEQISEEELAGHPDTRLRRRLLEAALGYYQTFLDQRHDDPSIQEDLVASRARVKNILAELTTLMGLGEYHLIHEDAVQNDLRLSKAQRGDVAALEQRSASRPEEWFGFMRLDPKTREQKLLEKARQQETAVGNILTPAQRSRFSQIIVQVRGPSAFSDSEVAEALQLTAVQQKSVRKILEDTRQADRSLPDNCPPDERYELSKENLKAGQTKILALLTKDQRQRWDEMTGVPFTGKISWRPGPFFGPGPGHGPGGRGGGFGKKGRGPGRDGRPGTPPPPVQ